MADEGTLAVLLGSAVSIVLAAVHVSRLAAPYRRRVRLESSTVDSTIHPA